MCRSVHFDPNALKGTPCQDCLKRQLSLLEGLSHDELEQLDRNRTKVDYKPGEILFKEGSRIQGLICLNQGKIKIYNHSASGVEQILSLKKPVDFLGLNDLLTGSIHHASAMAIDAVSVCIIEKEDFLRIAHKNMAFTWRINRHLAESARQTENRLLDLTQKHMRARMADGLLYILDFYGLRQEDDCVNFSLKRADMAALTNMTTANAIRVLSTFAQEKLISLDGRNLRIVRPDKIRHISLMG